MSDRTEPRCAGGTAGRGQEGGTGGEGAAISAVRGEEGRSDTAPGRGSGPGARLRATAADGTIRHLVLARRVVIGRSREADLVLEGSRVSRRHAAVELRDGRVRVEDLGSANGTWRLPRREPGAASGRGSGARRLRGPELLEPGEAIRIGEWTIAIEAGDGPGAGTAGREVHRAAAASAGVGKRAGAEAPPGRTRRLRARGGLLAGGAMAVSLAALAWVGGSARADRPAPGPAGSPESAAGGRARATGASDGAAVDRPATEAGAAARLDRWRVEVTEAKLLLAERQTAGDWPGVREAAERLAALDPLEPAARAAREALPREEEAAAREARAKEFEALGRDEEALALYTAIPRDSWHHGRARDAAVRLIRERVAPARREACRRLLAAGARARALPVCRGYLDLTCHERLDEPVVAAVRRAERSLRSEPWRCPAAFGAWLAEGEGKGDPSLERAVRQRYEPPEVAAALLAHFRDGRTREAREALEARERERAAGAPGAGRAAPSPGAASGPATNAAASPPLVPPAAELARRLEELDGRLVEARAKLLAGDLDRAAAAIGRAAAIEAELLPGGPASPALAAGRTALARAFRRRGDEHLALGRDGLAFAAFARGLEVSPADPALRRGLDRLEGRAASRLDQDPSCGAARAALATTASESAIRRRAEERLGSPACRAQGAF